MKHAKLLDCTLRDGAYIIDKKFGENTIKGIIRGLVKSKIDIIEIGFLQNEGMEAGDVVYKNSQDAKAYIPEEKGNSEFAVLADFSRYSIENLDECDGKSFGIVRECFFKKERFEAMKVCREIKNKGYKLFVQPVDIMGYSDNELLELIEMINEIEPYAFSIVDTFGSMYQEDLHRVFEIINHNLIKECRIGFHSHNNMQLSNALAQEFLRMTINKRKIVVDSTVYGMGRGAGNTPTELIAQYMVSKWGYNYDLNYILDIIDDYMDNIMSKCKWGYNAPNFIAGCYSAHVNNISYLTKKNSIRSKDIRYILNKIGEIPRKRYDYKLLEDTYVDYIESDIDDSEVIKELYHEFYNKDLLILVPGNSLISEKEKIEEFIDKTRPITISINFIHEDFNVDYIYMNNVKRYNYWKNSGVFKIQNKIIASNIKKQPSDSTEKIVSFKKLIKCGWEHLDNSALMLLRLLDQFKINSISIAGFDGYDYYGNNKMNYVLDDMELANVRENPMKINQEIAEMLEDYLETRNNKVDINFITESRFNVVLRNRKSYE